MYLIDSNILIYAREAGNSFLDTFVLAESAAVSEISLAEVFSYPGLTETQERDYEQVFSKIRMLAVSHLVWRRAAQIRKRHRCKLADAVVAATAIQENLVLVTRNTKDFKGIEGLHVLDPFEGNPSSSSWLSSSSS